MKLINNAKKFETNTESQSQEFSIGDASVVIEILRNRLYKHKVRTLVQEYISNARDATREISTELPIEVTCPTFLEPTFKVRDFGPGISPDRMSKVFIQYGSSTKRDSNNQVGGFGIGAKSAWSYTDSFNIITFINGIKRTYIAHTGVNNNGRLDHINTENTSEKNGTEISLAVAPKDCQEFKKSILRAIFFWTEKVKLNGIPENEVKKPKEVKSFSKTLSIHSFESLYSVHNQNGTTYYGDKENIISIDGIPYKLTSDLTTNIPNFDKLVKMINNTHCMVFSVPNGFLEVSASREEISNSEYTQKNLKRLIDENYTKLYNELKAKFDKAKTTQEYLNVYMELSKEFNVDCFSKTGDYTVKQGKITGEILGKVDIERCSISHEIKNGVTTEKVSKSEKTGMRRRSFYSWEPQVKLEEFNHLFYYDSTESMVKANMRIKEYLKTHKDCVIVSQRPDLTAIDAVTSKTTKTSFKKEFDQIVKDFNVKNLNTISYVEPPKQAKMKIPLTQKEFNLHHFDYGRKRIKRVTLQNNSQKWIYVQIGDKKNNGTTALYSIRHLNRYLIESKNEYRVCGLSKDNIQKVKNDSNFIDLDSWTKKFKPSDEDIKQYLRPKIQGSSNILLLEKLGDIKDKTLNEAIKSYNEIKITSKLNYEIPEMLEKQVQNADLYKKSLDINEKFCKLVKDVYPLVDHFSVNESPKILSELKLYINMKHKGVVK